MIVVLMGYMASGKSTIGSILARKLHFKFIDLDAYIEKRESRTIATIFKESGEIYFRNKETLYLEELLESNDKTVLALGGGTPTFGQNLQLITSNPNVQSYYLNVSIPNLVERLQNENNKRPLVAHLNSKDELIEFVGKHMFERLQFYKKAQHSIKTDNKSKDEIVEQIILTLF